MNAATTAAVAATIAASSASSGGGEVPDSVAITLLIIMGMSALGVLAMIIRG